MGKSARLRINTAAGGRRLRCIYVYNGKLYRSRSRTPFLKEWYLLLPVTNDSWVAPPETFSVEWRSMCLNIIFWTIQWCHHNVLWQISGTLRSRHNRSHPSSSWNFSMDHQFCLLSIQKYTCLVHSIHAPNDFLCLVDTEKFFTALVAYHCIERPPIFEAIFCVLSTQKHIRLIQLRKRLFVPLWNWYYQIKSSFAGKWN